MNDDFSKFKKYVLKNIELAGKDMLGHQKQFMRALYVEVKPKESIELILSVLEKYYNQSPYEKSLKKGWPNPRWSINWIYDQACCFADPEHWEYCDYFGGFPGAFDPPIDNERDENDREMALCYGV